MKKIILCFLTIPFFIISCEKGIQNSQDEDKNTSPTSDPWTSCSATAHPFSVKNIEEAYAGLGLMKKSAKELTLYKYVRFLPDSAELLTIESDTSIKLYNIPLADPKLYSWKNQLQKSTRAGDALDPQYAIVPLNQVLPNVNYTILDTLYFPDFDTEKDLYFAANILAGTIKVDSAAIDTMSESIGQKSTQGWKWLKKAVKWAKNAVVGYNPSGTLAVDGNLIEGVNVEVLAWGQVYKGKTDASGYFYIDKKIHIYSIVYLCFENDYCNIRLWNFDKLLSIVNAMNTSRYYVCDKSAPDLPNMKINLNRNNYGGFCSTITNAVEKYHKLAINMGIGVPPRVNIVALWGKTSEFGNASTPMINYLMGSSFIDYFFDKYLSPNFSLVPSNISVLDKLLPDIIIPETSNFDYEKVTLTMLHELTHAAHAKKVGKAFWLKVMTGEIRNSLAFKKNPYGYRGSEFSGQVGLAEAWANDVSNYMMNTLFNDPNTYISDNMENWYSKSNKDALEKWTPKGLFFDLFDFSNQFKDKSGFIIESRITDNVSGIPYSSMFLNFSGASDDFTFYKSRLKSSFSAKAADIDELFSQYSF
jgi:hypothetical protein